MAVADTSCGFGGLAIQSKKQMEPRRIKMRTTARTLLSFSRLVNWSNSAFHCLTPDARTKNRTIYKGDSGSDKGLWCGRLDEDTEHCGRCVSESWTQLNPSRRFRARTYPAVVEATKKLRSTAPILDGVTDIETDSPEVATRKRALMETTNSRDDAPAESYWRADDIVAKASMDELTRSWLVDERNDEGAATDTPTVVRLGGGGAKDKQAEPEATKKALDSLLAHGVVEDMMREDAVNFKFLTTRLGALVRAGKMAS